MAQTRADFYKQGFDNATNRQFFSLHVENDWAMPSFGENTSWQSKAFAAGWKDGAEEARLIVRSGEMPGMNIRPAKVQRAIDAMARGYLACALWSETDENGCSLDEYDPSECLVAFAKKVCRDFYDAKTVDLWAFADLYPQRFGTRHDAWEAAGHDLWLTSQGHGTGFWDRGLGRLGKRLSDVCGFRRPFTTVDLYVDRDSLQVKAA